MGADLRDYHPEAQHWGQLRRYLTQQAQHWEQNALVNIGQAGERDQRREANAVAAAYRNALAKMAELEQS